MLCGVCARRDDRYAGSAQHTHTQIDTLQMCPIHLDGTGFVLAGTVQKARTLYIYIDVCRVLYFAHPKRPILYVISTAAPAQDRARVRSLPSGDVAKQRRRRCGDKCCQRSCMDFRRAIEQRRHYSRATGRTRAPPPPSSFLRGTPSSQRPKPRLCPLFLFLFFFSLATATISARP